MKFAQYKQQAQKGFTLIELMIVVAIIGILAAVAIPAYQDYVIKGQASAALAEITPGKAGMEMAVNEGKTPSTTASADGFIGVAASTSYCDVTVANTTATGTITCATKGGNANNFNTKNIVWTRDNVAGTWSCSTTLDAKYRPGKCAGTTGGTTTGG